MFLKNGKDSGEGRRVKEQEGNDPRYAEYFLFLIC